MGELAQVMELRKGSNVRRYHTEFIVGEQTVGQHSHGVAMLLFQYYPHMCRTNVLIACLTHDLAEGYTGDIPAPAKWENPEFAEILGRVEEDQLETLGIVNSLSEAEWAAVGVCDRLEGLLFSYEQVKKGNHLFKQVFSKFYKWLEDQSNQGPMPTGIKHLVSELNFQVTVGDV